MSNSQWDEASSIYSFEINIYATFPKSSGLESILAGKETVLTGIGSILVGLESILVNLESMIAALRSSPQPYVTS